MNPHPHKHTLTCPYNYMQNSRQDINDLKATPEFQKKMDRARQIVRLHVCVFVYACASLCVCICVKQSQDSTTRQHQNYTTCKQGDPKENCVCVCNLILFQHMAHTQVLAYYARVVCSVICTRVCVCVCVCLCVCGVCVLVCSCVCLCVCVRERVCV